MCMKMKKRNIVQEKQKYLQILLVIIPFLSISSMAISLGLLRINSFYIFYNELLSLVLRQNANEIIYRYIKYNNFTNTLLKLIQLLLYSIIINYKTVITCLIISFGCSFFYAKIIILIHNI